MRKRMKILIGYDGSMDANDAIHDLRQSGLPKEVEALIVSVEESPIVPPLARQEGIDKAFVEWTTKLANHADIHVADALSQAKSQAEVARHKMLSYFPKWKVTAIAIPGRAASELIQEADNYSADLIVIGSQGRSALGRFIMGSVSLEVALQSPCSVRIGRSKFARDPRVSRRMVVGVDALAGSEQAIKQVLERVWPSGSELRVVAFDENQPAIREVISTEHSSNGKVPLSEFRGLKVTAEIRRGDPADVLISEADDWEADCIFIGGHFGSGSYGSQNSVVKDLATKASCSVEIVR